ncbi:importin subunit beta-3 [Savitreella phatthalungensis]
MADLVTLLSALTSVDNNVRTQAEKSLNEEWIAQRPDVLLVGLAEQAGAAQQVALRSFSAVLLRRIAPKDSPSNTGDRDDTVWDSCSGEAQARIKALVIDAFGKENESTVRHKLADLIAELVQSTNEPWPEAVQALFTCAQSAQPSYRESVFRVFGVAPDMLEDAGADLNALFRTGLEDPAKEVRLAAVQAFTMFLTGTDDARRNALAPLIPALLNVLPPMLAEKDSEGLTFAFNALNELVEMYPKMFSAIFNSMVNFGIAVLKDKTIEDSARQAALECLVIFAEGAPGMCRKDPNYASELVVECLALLTDLGDDDEVQEWLDAEDIDADESDANHVVGEQALDRLARKLGGKTLLPPAFTWLPKLISSQNWRERHAALMALSCIAEGCEKIMRAELDKVLQLVLPALADPHPRVRWAGCNAIGQMSTDFQGDVQEKFTAQVLGALIPALEAPESRVAAHASAAFVNFFEQSEEADLEPYLDPILERLLNLLRRPQKYVQEQAVTTIATVADAANTKFAKYYSVIMPLLIGVLRDAQGDDYKLLRGKAMECASLIALAVGKELFAPQANELIQLLGNIQSSLAPDDLQSQYLISAWGRICKVLGADFHPYLQAVMPPLLVSAKLKPDFTVVADEEAKAEYAEEEGWEFFPVRGQHVGIKTSTLEDKCSATEMLVIYASELKQNFQPYVNDVLTEIAIPGLTFFYHDGVREASCHLLPQLLNCIKLATPGAPVQEAWSSVSRKLLDLLQREPSIEILSELFQAMYECIEVVPELLTDDDMAALVTSTEAQLRDYMKRAETRAADHRAGDVDLEQDEDALLEIEADETMLGEASKALHVVFKHKHSAFIPHWQRLLPYVDRFSQTSDANCRQWAVCVYDDVIEFCGADAWQFRDRFVKPLASGLTDEAAEVRQAAAYGIGVAAQHGGDVFSDLVAQSLPSLFQLATSSEAKDIDNVYVTENAVCTIAKICRFNASKVTDLPQVIHHWVALMPVTHDEQDAPYAYRFLGELLETRDNAVVSQLPHVADAIAQALESAVIEGNNRDLLLRQFKTLLAGLGQQQAQQLITAIQPESRRSVLMAALQ